MEETTNKEKPSLIVRLFPIPFIVIGFCTLVIGVRQLQRSVASQDWPTASGVIQNSSVEAKSDSDSGTTYHAEILYDYTVDGTKYSGNRVDFGEYGTGEPTHARRIVNRYPPEKKVEVHYLPDDPELSVLEPGMKAQAWVLPCFGLVFFVGGVLMAIFFPKGKWKRDIS
jgi:hypothetical protein